MSKIKVIFHIDETSKWKLLLANVSNLLQAINNKEYDIEVLANSEAVKYYDITQNPELSSGIMESLSSKGVKFVACNNSLLANKIEKEDIIYFVDVVPTGVLELAIKQSEGYAYIKP